MWVYDHLLLVACSPALHTHAWQLATPSVFDLDFAVLTPAVIAEDMSASHVGCFLARHITEAASTWNFSL